MFKFENKKKIREERDAALDALAEAVEKYQNLDKEKNQIKEDLDYEKGRNKILTQDKSNLEDEMKALKKKVAAKDKRLAKMRKTVFSQCAKKTTLIRENKKLKKNIVEAIDLIDKLNQEIKRLKDRPTLVQLMNEKEIPREKRNK